LRERWVNYCGGYPWVRWRYFRRKAVRHIVFTCVLLVLPVSVIWAHLVAYQDWEPFKIVGLTVASPIVIFILWGLIGLLWESFHPALCLRTNGSSGAVHYSKLLSRHCQRLDQIALEYGVIPLSVFISSVYTERYHKAVEREKSLQCCIERYRKEGISVTDIEMELEGLRWSLSRWPSIEVATATSEWHDPARGVETVEVLIQSLRRRSPQSDADQPLLSDLEGLRLSLCRANDAKERFRLRLWS
jgi:hypothetical protein